MDIDFFLGMFAVKMSVVLVDLDSLNRFWLPLSFKKGSEIKTIIFKILTSKLKLSTSARNVWYVLSVKFVTRGDSHHHQRGPEDDEHRP